MDPRGELTAILGKARAFWEARILMTAAELDVFSLLADTPKTAAQVCENMSCVTRACKAAWSCAFGQMCELDEAAETYGDCYEPEGPYCDECDGQDPDSCGEENLCVNFQDEDGNDKGAFCLVACNLDDPDNLCPQGWECAELEDQDGNVDHQCARTCYQPPVTDY